jgi:hypothetical protein
MYLLADLRTGSFDLMEASDCESFSVRVVGRGELADLERVLADCGDLDGDHMWISVDVVRKLALYSTAQGWDVDFAAMVDYAGSKGWLDPTGERIRGHIDWPGAD